MRILITGGTGLIGRALSASLAADGSEVIVLSRDPEGAKGLPSGVRAVRWAGRPGSACRPGFSAWSWASSPVSSWRGSGPSRGG